MMLRPLFICLISGGLLLAAFLPNRAVLEAGSSAFSATEWQAFSSLEPVDTHAHAFQIDPAFYGMLRRLHIHLLDICTPNRHDPNFADLPSKIEAAKAFVQNSAGHAALCTTFDPFRFSEPIFAKDAIRQLDTDFAQGAVAVKIWKNIGMELKNTSDHFVLPDDPRFEPVYQSIAAHSKTLIAHIADPDSCWQPPNKNSPDYNYFQQHPEWYMYTKPDHPSKATILQARDHMLEQNPTLRVVGAHLGSSETDLDEVARRLDRYPNFAVDVAARVVYLALQPREKVRRFLIKYQTRVLYGTDLGFYASESAEAAKQRWEKQYAMDWRFFASEGTVEYRNRTVQGLGLSREVLRLIYHENAARWIPGVVRPAIQPHVPSR
jgi:predicted TIM-barrel fold metal-dependent hydrolase